MPRAEGGEKARKALVIGDFETRSFPNSLVAYPGDFTFYVVRPRHSVVSRLLPQRLTATSRLYRPYRSTLSLHYGIGTPEIQNNLFQAELFADSSCERVLDLGVSRHGHNPPVRWINVKIVICAVTF